MDKGTVDQYGKNLDTVVAKVIIIKKKEQEIPRYRPDYMNIQWGG